jgi:apolipoprotein D and lipocalin family protein
MIQRLVIAVLSVCPIAALSAEDATTTKAATATASASAPAPPLPALAPIAALDINRYMGTWYELARYPNRFQRQCAGPARAEYKLQPDGRVQVLNACPLPDGSEDRALGEARRVGPTGSATLQVRFAPAWLSLLPFVWGDYWVIDLDEAYTLVAVSEPKREYLWVLSRTPQPDAAAWQALQSRLQQRGFDLGRLQSAGPVRR